jgi:hypothetical protein
MRGPGRDRRGVHNLYGNQELLPRRWTQASIRMIAWPCVARTRLPGEHLLSMGTSFPDRSPTASQGLQSSMA